MALISISSCDWGWFITAISIKRLLSLLQKQHGPQNWWPGETAFEVMVGAILTQNTSWKNVERVIQNLKADNLLSPVAIASADTRRLQRAIRPSGFYIQKSGYLKALARHIATRYQGDVELMKSRPMEELREELLELPGVGEETADSVLLYSFGMPSFVIDAYTRRLLGRLGMNPGASYSRLKRRFEAALKGDVDAYSDMHALIVVHSKSVCRKDPDCRSCTLRGYCPSSRED